MKSLFYLITGMLLTSALSSFSQISGYQFSQLNINGGLSNNEVTCILKDRAGFMWFGTMSGLNRFDGYDVKIFRRDLKDSLSINDDYIETIHQGPDNKLWIRTRAGMNIYDPSTERFSRASIHYFQSLGIADDNIKDVLTDAQGNSWILSRSSGLYKFERGKERAKALRHHVSDPRSLRAALISDIALNSKGNIWILHNDGQLEELNPSSSICSSRFRPDQFAGIAGADLRLFIDKQDDLWIYNVSDPQGVYYLRCGSRRARRFSVERGSSRINSNLVNGVSQDSKGQIWVATDHGGLNIIDKHSFSVKCLLNSEDDAKSLAQNCITTLYRDDRGIIWAGTFKKGVSYYHENIIRFPLVKKRPFDHASLPYNDVNQFVEDERGNVWIGTNGGGLLYYDRTANSFRQYLNDPGNPNSLSNNVIVSLCLDHNQDLWIGTYYGGMDRLRNGKFTHYRHDERYSNSISDDRVWHIFEDSKRRLWIGTLHGGLNLFDRASGRFIRYSNAAPHSLNSTYVSSLIEDRKGDLWIGTSDGVNILNPESGKFRYLTYASGDKNSLSNNNVATMFRDSRSRIYVGTREGLNIFDADGSKIATIGDNDGLPANAVLGIQEDKQHRIWVSTPNGLGMITLFAKGQGKTGFKVVSYDENDGLQGKAFNERSSGSLRSGELIFGGANGFNLFDPAMIKPLNDYSPVVLTQLDVFNKPVEIGSEVNGSTLLKKSLWESDEITLSHNQNVFSLEFAALNFIQPDKIKYRYILEGFDKSWITVDSRDRKATYTNLDPGDYVFRVKRVSNDAKLDDGQSLHIHVLPPFWKTRAAYAAYLVLLVTGIYVSRRRAIRRIERKFMLERERQEARRTHEMDLMKIKFFTNVSHEFRTPIALILAPLQKLISQSMGIEHKKQLLMIERNAGRLLHMVNQLLDFRKLEMSEHRLTLHEGDLVSHIKEIVASFTDIAEKKNIAYNFDANARAIIGLFDPGKIERILFNLISNAFKFTLPNGSIVVSLRVLQHSDTEPPLITLAVSDTGIGIAQDKLQEIFEQFVQAELPPALINQGTGIGLSITREFVHLHGGSIAVESEPGQGSTFRIQLPLKLLTFDLTPEDTCFWAIRPMDRCRPLQEACMGIVPASTLKLLIVEDNEDFLYYLKDNLQQYFQIDTATNGKEAWQKALARHPDLIVSDVMMPEMDGLQLCDKIRKDERTAHIPLILLTAQLADEQMLTGLGIGASDYMTKPFNFQVLLAKIRSILKHQDTIKKTYQKQIEVKPAVPDLPDPELKLMQQVLEAIEVNISNPDFTVEELSAAVNMSRVTLYKKIIILTGLAPLDFIRSIRLKKAAQLLERESLTISEIAYEVGFSSPKYFARMFKAEYGVLPSGYLTHKQEAHAAT